MESVLAFVAGVVVGVVGLLGLQAVRRSSPVASPTDRPTRPPAGSGAFGSVLAGLGGGTHARVTVSGSRSLIRMDRDGAPTVEIDGTTFHRLADVPADARALLVDELRVVRDTPDLPAGVLHGIDAFLADEAGTDRADSPGPA